MSAPGHNITLADVTSAFITTARDKHGLGRFMPDELPLLNEMARLCELEADSDYSPAYQDEYRRQWIEARGEVERLAEALSEIAVLAVAGMDTFEIGRIRALVRAALAGSVAPSDPAPREGMVTVHDEHGAYLGCMGIETWKKLLAPFEGWYGVAWEPAQECIYCGHRVGEANPPHLRASKVEHRSTCPINNERPEGRS